MAHYDIVPDIHGQTAKLDALLRGLGYGRRRGRWHHPAPDRQIVFLGDFIDRGPDSGGVLATVRDLVAGRWDDPLHEDVATLTKGPEARLPEGESFTDRTGHVRSHVRLAWWRRGARSWREAAISVPDPLEVTDAPLPEGTATDLYPQGEKPVFFGHYWLEEMPRIEAPNALCLDCSAGIGDKPLVAYAWEPGASGLSLEAVVGGRGEAPPAAARARLG